MSDKKVFSIAEIARQLDVPESTLHYWKNRFAQYLPSVGKNRQKRFRPEAVQVFRDIRDLLNEGLPAKDVMAELARRHPVMAQCVEPEAAADNGAAEHPAGQAPAMGQEQVLAMAASIGGEIARSIAEGLSGALAQPAAQPQLSIDDGELKQMREALEGQGEDVGTLKAENMELKAKLGVLEAELVRLRKDRRELEKFLLDKIRKMPT